MRKRIVITIVILAAIFASFFVYRYWKNKKVEQLRLQQEQAKQSEQEICPVEISFETKEQCLERVKNFDVAGLANEVLRLKGVGDTYKDTNVETDVYGPLLMIKKLNCDLLADKNEQIYQIALNFVGQINFPDQGKKDFENWFKGVYAGTYKSEFLRLGANIALGDLGKICPVELPKICAEILDARSLGGQSAGISEYCSGLCGKLETFEKDRNSFSETNAEEFSPSVSARSYLNKAAALYRFQGQEAALRLCVALPEEQKRDCQKNIYRLEPYKVGCENISDAVKEFVCNNTEK